VCRLGHVHVACMLDDGGPTTRCAGFMLRFATCYVTWGSRGVAVAFQRLGPHRLVSFVLCARFWIWSNFKRYPWHTDNPKASRAIFIVVRDRFVISYLVSRFNSCRYSLVLSLEGRVVESRNQHQFTALFAS
jgi:hypothetical protein